MCIRDRRSCVRRLYWTVLGWDKRRCRTWLGLYQAEQFFIGIFTKFAQSTKGAWEITEPNGTYTHARLDSLIDRGCGWRITETGCDFTLFSVFDNGISFCSQLTHRRQRYSAKCRLHLLMKTDKIHALYTKDCVKCTEDEFLM